MGERRPSEKLVTYFEHPADVTAEGTGSEPRRFPRVHGKCPACGGNTLFLGAGGYVTCSLIGCSDPCRADQVLSGEVGSGHDEQTEALERAALNLKLAADDLERLGSGHAASVRESSRRALEAAQVPSGCSNKQAEVERRLRISTEIAEATVAAVVEALREGAWRSAVKGTGWHAAADFIEREFGSSVSGGD